MLTDEKCKNILLVQNIKLFLDFYTFICIFICRNISNIIINLAFFHIVFAKFNI